jgi:hypothetical protein
MRSRRSFKRYNIFVEAFHSTIKGIHLALEVKTAFGNSRPTMGPGTESSSQKPGVFTDSLYWHHWKKEKKKHAHKRYKAKFE